MPSYQSAFESMMAGATAPPLSLCEFRLFISHDPKARNALAFCEWYQQYKSVYFDHAPFLSTVPTRSQISKYLVPTTYAPPGQSINDSYQWHTSVWPMPVSVPNFHQRRWSDSAVGDLVTLKSHSFCALEGNIFESAFQSVSTGSSSEPESILAQACATHSLPLDIASCVYCDTPQHGYNAQSLGCQICQLPPSGRRRTLPILASISGFTHQASRQAEDRISIQSLLIFECWARFLCANGHELVDIPEQELMYVLERLPLNITHLPQRLLCHNDMLTSKPSLTGVDGALLRNVMTESAKESTSLNIATPNTDNMFHRSLQVESHAANVNDGASHSEKYGPACCTMQAPLSAKEKSSCISYTKYFSKLKPTANGGYASLPRMSTVPTSNHSRAITSSQWRPAPTHPCECARYPSCSVCLVGITQLQRCPSALRPRPHFAATISDASNSFPVTGYRHIPKQLTQLIIPNNVPPALFETIAKLSTDYLYHNYFADFYRCAHCNVTTSEQKAALAFALVVFVLGIGVAAIFIAMGMSVAWRMLAVPILLCATSYFGIAWSRVSIWRWCMCKRPTVLILKSHLQQCRVGEKSYQNGLKADSDLYALRSITGTLLLNSRYLTGAFQGGCSQYDDRCDIARGTHKIGTQCHFSSANALSPWPYDLSSARIGVIGYMSKYFSRLLMKMHKIGDQWRIDLNSRLYPVFEPIVLCNQFHTVCHQLVLMTAALCVFTVVLLFVL